MYRDNMKYRTLLVLVVVAALAAAQVDAQSRRMLDAVADAADPTAVPQGGNSGPDSWQWGAGAGGGKIWQRPGFGGGGGGHGKWGDMQSQGATTVSTAASPDEVAGGPQPANQNAQSSKSAAQATAGTSASVTTAP